MVVIQRQDGKRGRDCMDSRNRLHPDAYKNGSLVFSLEVSEQGVSGSPRGLNVDSLCMSGPPQMATRKRG